VRAGFHLIVKYFGIDKIYKRVKANIQYDISLFNEPDKEKVQIDLKEGGKIILKDPRIWIKVTDPLTAVNEVLNFEEQLKEIVEHRLTGYLNALTFDEVMMMKYPKILKKARPGKEVLIQKVDKIIKRSTEIENFVKRCKIEYEGFTLDDFDFDERTTAKREERIISEMEKEVAANVATARRNEMAAIAETAKVLSGAGFPKDLGAKTASERYQDHLAAEKGELRKIIWSGEEPVPEIAAQWKMGMALITPKTPKGKISPEAEGSESGSETSETKKSSSSTEEDDWLREAQRTYVPGASFKG
jgi:hypothetical protein